MKTSCNECLAKSHKIEKPSLTASKEDVKRRWNVELIKIRRENEKKAVGKLLFELNQETLDVAHKTIAWKLRPMMQRVRPKLMRCQGCTTGTKRKISGGSGQWAVGRRVPRIKKETQHLLDRQGTTWLETPKKKQTNNKTSFVDWSIRQRHLLLPVILRR